MSSSQSNSLASALPESVPFSRTWQRRYIIDLKGIKAIPAFDLKDVQVTNHGYGYIVRHGRLRPDDEQSVLTYLQSIGVVLP